MKPWKLWKSGFDLWETTTAGFLDKALQSPALLGPTGKVLKVVMQSKSVANRALASGWNAVGLTSRADQDKALHRLNQLESQLFDLQEDIEVLREES